MTRLLIVLLVSRHGVNRCNGIVRTCRGNQQSTPGPLVHARTLTLPPSPQPSNRRRHRIKLARKDVTERLKYRHGEFFPSRRSFRLSPAFWRGGLGQSGQKLVGGVRGSFAGIKVPRRQRRYSSAFPAHGRLPRPSRWIFTRMAICYKGALETKAAISEFWLSGAPSTPSSIPHRIPHRSRRVPRVP